VESGTFKRLPFNFCSLSLQPFEHPVCTANGTIFDLTHILPWLKKHGTNPVDGSPLKSADLIKLNFSKNDDNEYVDPVTYKVFTNNTHIVALKVSGNVFAWDTVERLNIKAKNWSDLVSDEAFSRKDIITLQDPQNLGSRDLSSFKYMKDGTSTLTEEQQAERDDPANDINAASLGNASRILRAREAVAKSRAEREKGNNPNQTSTSSSKALTTPQNNKSTSAMAPPKAKPYNAAAYTTGRAAASFTSTGLTPNTSGERAILSDEEYMLKPKRVRQKGYARMSTSCGDLNFELYPEFAPKAVWNFVKLAQRGYYRDQRFHRNIRNFMIQGGDPTGTGKGGQSVWGKNFEDEFDGPLTHDVKGTLSMANKGKGTNSSQFFITYRPAKHLDRKHTIFGRVVGGTDTLSRLENVKTDDKDRPLEDVLLEDVVVYVDPFEEFLKERSDTERKEAEMAEVKRQGGTEDDRTTWTGKRVRPDGKVVDEGGGGVGKYLKATMARGGGVNGGGEGDIVGDWDEAEEPAQKKSRLGGFGNFDSW